MKALKVNILPICILLISFMTVAGGEAVAATYYASPTGSGNTCSDSSPCTPEYAIDTKSRPGDTILLKDGTYNCGDNSNMCISIDTSGISGAPKTVRAIHPGSVIIDGQSKRKPCVIFLSSWIDVEDIKCTNSNETVFTVSGSSNINIRRVSASNASTGNYVIFIAQRNSTTLTPSSYVLFEDCFAYGTGRKMFQANRSHHITFRRNWAQFYQTSDPGNPVMECFDMYPGDDNLLENNICTEHPNGIGTPTGFKVSSNPWDEQADRNKFMGNITYDVDSYGYQVYSGGNLIQDNKFYNNVGINVKYGMNNRGGKNTVAQNNTLINHTASTSGSFSVSEPGGVTPDSDWMITTTVKNSVFMESSGRGFYVGSGSHIGSQTHNYNTYWGIDGVTYEGTTGGTHDNNETIQPNYNIATYGKGAYLIRPSNLSTSGEGGTYRGAEVLYRYENGQLTNVPLWPWPMESRICAETGYSVTYENGYAGCTKGGGLWKTLNNVYALGSPSPSDLPQDTAHTVEVDPAGTYIEAEDYTSTIVQGTATFSVAGLLSGYEGTGYLVSNGGWASTCPPVHEGKEYQLNFTKAGTYNVWIRGYAANDGSDTAFIGLDGNCVGSIKEGGIYNKWNWTNSIQNGLNKIYVPTTGEHTFNIWVRESNHLLDKIYLTQGMETPSGKIVTADTTPPVPPIMLRIQ